MFLYLSAVIEPNVLQLPEGGDFEALHYQPSRNFDRSTKLDLTTEPPLLGRCCYRLCFYFPCQFVSFFICFVVRRDNVNMLRVRITKFSVTNSVNVNFQYLTSICPSLNKSQVIKTILVNSDIKNTYGLLFKIFNPRLMRNKFSPVKMST